MSRTDELTLVFQQDGISFDLTKLGDFLLLFRAMYAGAIHPLSEIDLGDVLADPERAILQVQNHFRSLSIKELNHLFVVDLREHSLMASSIVLESPLTIKVTGYATALVVAVIFSGGQIKGSNFEVQLPPIGTGIQSLREALRPLPHTDFAYGLCSLHVKLNHDELTELMKHDPETRHHGGFQKFLVSLQLRVDPKTGHLELSESDIDMIYKYGRHPEHGGWQKSIYRIFVRHFGLAE